MNEGWIKTHRKMLKWEWSSDPNMVALFWRMLLTACHEESNWRGITLKPGQFIFGRKEWAIKTGISEQTLRTCLNRLKSTNEITTKATSKFTIVTIVKWSEYQFSQQQATSESTSNPTNNQPATNQQLTTYKEVKNIRNNNNNRSAIDKGRLPMDIPAHWLNWSIEQKQWDKTTSLIVWKEFQGYWNRQIGHNALLTIEEWETKWKAYCLKQNIKPANKTTKSESKPHGKYRTQF